MRVIQPEPGIFIWTTTTGHTYRRESDGTTTLIDVAPPRPDQRPRHTGQERQADRPGSDRATERPQARPTDKSDNPTDNEPPPF